jgi:hypothetical protein
VNCCTERCGWCGRCDDGLSNRPEPAHGPLCDYCGTTFGSGGVSVAGLGTFCGYKCRVLAEHKRAAERKVS